MKSKWWCVYKHTNLVNGKVYIGITQQEINKRWRSGAGYQRHKHFYAAIQKYGWDNFSHEIIEDGLLKEEAALIEIELIKKYESTNREKGYNKDIGGFCGHTIYQTISQYSLQGERIATFESALEARRSSGCFHITDCCNFKYKKDNNYMWRFGKEEKIEPYKRNEHINEKSVEQYDKYGNFIAVYKSLKDAEEKTGVSFKSISQCCIHTSHEAYGYIWKFQKDVDFKIVPLEDIYKEMFEKQKVKFAQYSLDGKFICNFLSLKEAQEKTGISRSSICSCASGRHKSAGGFMWRRFEELPLMQILPYKKIGSAVKQTSRLSRKAVYQYTKEGLYLDSFDAIAEAAHQTGVNKAGIWCCCNGRKETAGGYKWKYKEVM